jgi:hypothetical protein
MARQEMRREQAEDRKLSPILYQNVTTQREAVPEFRHLKSMGMGMNRELAQPESIRSARRRNRWYGPGISLCLARPETGTVPRKPAVNWNKVLGLVTALVVVVVGWTAVGIAVSYVLR